MFGNLVLLKRWHWIVIAIIVGIAAGFAAQPTSLELRSDYGNVLNGQKEFETGLVKDVQGTPRFKDIVIHRQSVESPAGPSHYVWVISGRYCPGTPDPFDGNLHWKPAVYIAPDPYHPKSNLAELLPSASASDLAKFKQQQHPTALDFLRLVSKTTGLDYTHAWWRSYATATWLMMSIILLGVAFPTTIDLVVYGKFIRPREKKGTRLTAAPIPAPAAKPEITAEEQARLAALEAALEEGLKETDLPNATPTSAAAERPVTRLNGQADTRPAAVATQDPRSFGAKPDDYYPTEQKGKSIPTKPRG